LDAPLKKQILWALLFERKAVKMPASKTIDCSLVSGLNLPAAG